MIIVFIYMVHDTENLTFSEEFRGCSVRNDADFPHGCHGTSTQALRNFRTGGHGFSVRAGAKANFVRNNAKGSRNTLQGLFKISLWE